MFTDLHLHTKYSDGKLSVNDTINIAKDKNIEMLSITDHDSVGGVKEAIDISRIFNITCISGMELSCRNENKKVLFPQDISIHLLSYNLDYENEFIKSYLKQYHFQRYKILLDLIKELSANDFDVKYEEIPVIAGSQMRVQDIINYINSSFCSKKKKDKLINIANGYYTNLFNEDCTLSNAIKIIKHAGGIPVLAHAFFSYKDYNVIKNDKDSVLSLIKYLYELGLEGIEVFYSKFDKMQTEWLLKIAKDNNLMITAGSDFHGTPLRKVMIDYDIGQLNGTIRKLQSINRYG